MNLIDIQPMKESWGRVWQGGEFSDADDVPEPRATISMVGQLFSLQHLSLSIYMNDTPESCLPDKELLSMTDAAIGLLTNGMNVFLHCFQGKSRSSYLNCAIHMRAMNLSYDDSLSYIKRQHPIAQPNAGFEAQLKRMDKVLRGQ